MSLAKRSALAFTFIAIVALLTDASSALAQWADDFFVGPGLPWGDAKAIAVVGDDVYVGGLFADVGGIPGTSGIARWNRTEERWYALGYGVSNQVYSLAADGDNLYVGGNFVGQGVSPAGDDPTGPTNEFGDVDFLYIARWSISEQKWYALGSGILTAQPSVQSANGVKKMAIKNRQLWVGGYYVNAGGIADADVVATWHLDNETWSSVGQIFLNPYSGASYPQVNELISLGGDSVFVSCNCAYSDSLFRNAIYAGGSWTRMDAMSGSTGDPDGMGVFAADWDGSDLYLLRGDEGFIGIDGVPDGTQLMRFDGTSYHPMGGAFDDRSVPVSLALFDGEIVVGVGDKNSDPRPHLVHHTGTGFEPYGPELDGQPSVLVAEGDDLWVGGYFSSTEDESETFGGLVRWDGQNSYPLGRQGGGLYSTYQIDVSALAVFDGEVYAGGYFENASNDAAADFVARWDGSQWRAAGTGFNRNVQTLYATDGRLYAGGAFFEVAGTQNHRLAQFDGTDWAPLGPGFGTGTPKALATIGTDLYVGGSFYQAGGVTDATNFARWDGSSWHAVTHAGGSDRPNDTVNALLEDDDGTLLVGGKFTSAAGHAYVARWDPASSTYSAVGNAYPNGTVHAIARMGDNVVVGGAFTDLNGAKALAIWDGTEWTAIGEELVGFESSSGSRDDPVVWALAVDGDNLFVSGDFERVGDDPATMNIARWDGSNWHPVSSGLRGGIVADLLVHEGRIWAGGGFHVTGDGSVISYGVGNHPLPDFVSVEDTDQLNDDRRRIAFGSGDVAVGVWPNPARAADVRLEVASKTSRVMTVSVYDVLGRRVADVYSGPVAADDVLELSLPGGVVSTLAPGLYAVRAGEQATAFVTITR